MPYSLLFGLGVVYSSKMSFTRKGEKMDLRLVVRKELDGVVPRSLYEGCHLYCNGEAKPKYFAVEGGKRQPLTQMTSLRPQYRVAREGDEILGENVPPIVINF